MRNSKIVALVATAALLVLGAAMTAFAATAWVEESGSWRFYDKDGEAVTNEFRKSGSDWYWLDEDGFMATETLVEYNDALYYVDASGKMVKNQWVSVENTDGAEGFEDHIWYYFQNSGKSYKTKKATINGQKYLFDDECRMLFGWINGADDNFEMVDNSEDKAWETGLYYCGGNDDGAMRKSQWEKLEVWDDDVDSIGGEDTAYWFYFNSNGQKLYDCVKTINGKKYAFDESDGHMLYEWVEVATPDVTTSSAAGYGWFQDAETGARLTRGWFRTAPTKIIDSTANDEDESHWFYAKGNGDLYQDTIKSINGKSYGFAHNGEMVSGLYGVIYDAEAGTFDFVEVDGVDVKVDDVTTYGEDDSFTTVEDYDRWLDNFTNKTGLAYFGDEETDGAMKVGTTTVEVDGDEYSFKFATKGTNKGRGINGKDGNNWYVNGKKVCADGDVKYQLYKASEGFGKTGAVMLNTKAKSAEHITNKGSKDAPMAEKYWCIASNGVVAKSGTKKDADGYKIHVSGGLVQYIDAE